jgi:hypothetical protein
MACPLQACGLQWPAFGRRAVDDGEEARVKTAKIMLRLDRLLG